MNQQKKVLCIEDEYFISELYVRALTKAGYSVTVESDGKSAFPAADRNIICWCLSQLF